MNYPLYRWLVRRSAFSLVSWVVTLAFYEWLLIWLYPSIAKSAVLSAALRTLPQGLLSAFGLGSAHETLTVFLSSEFFMLIWILALAYFVAVEASRLPAGMLDRGQMTALLLTPATRRSIALAASAALLTEILLLDAGSLVAAALLASAYGVSLAGVHFPLLGLGSFILLALLSAVGMAASCTLSGERTVLGVAGGIAFVLYVLDFAARISPRISWLDHLTPFSAYRPEALLAGNAPAVALALMAGAAIVIVLAAAAVFAARDLRGA